MTMRHQAPDLHRALDDARASGKVVVELMAAVQEVIDLMAATLHDHQAGQAQLSPWALLQLTADMRRLARTASDANDVILERLAATSAHIECALEILHRVYSQHNDFAALVAVLNETLVALEVDFRAIRRNEQRVIHHVETLLGLADRLDTPAEVIHCVGDLLRRLRLQVPPH